MLPSSTMSDVARRAGVHPATVSRALRDDPRISVGQRDHIRRVAKEMGYRTNPLVAALMTVRRAGQRPRYQATFGYITKYPRERAVQFEQDFGGILAGARARARTQGYQIEEFNLDDDDFPLRRATQILRHRGIQGLLVAPLHSAQEAVALDWTQFTTVAIGYSLSHVAVSRVAHNHFTAYLLAAARCRAAGWRRLGLVLQRRVHEKVEKRWVAASLLDQSEQSPRTRVPPLLLNAHDGGTSSESNVEQLNAWLRRYRPEVVLGANIREIQNWCRALKTTSANSVRLVSLDRRPEDKGMAGIDQDYAGAGASAIDLLVGMAQRNEQGLPVRPITVVTDGMWVDDDSLRTRE
jgi:LacI family transcriptional regulator